MSEEKKIIIEKGIYNTRYAHGLCRVRREYVDPVTKEKILEGDSRKFKDYSWQKTRWNSEGRVICGDNECDIGPKFELDADTITEEFMKNCYEIRGLKETSKYLQERVGNLESFTSNLRRGSWWKRLLRKFRRKK